MRIYLILNYLLFINVILCEEHNPSDKPNDCECYKRIHRECNHDINFSEQEIENARLYIQNRFLTEPKIKPVRPACQKLHVRKDFKCLTHEERIDVIEVFKQLYRNGVMDKFAWIHSHYWPETHKFSEGLIWHRWFVTEFEKEMRKIKPDITLPYWRNHLEFAAPQESIIWDYFGHAGNAGNDYCVADGPFAYQQVLNGKPHCLRRQWNENKTIPILEPLEWVTAVLQISDSWQKYGVLGGFNYHFKTHLAIGGWAGDMSITVANNDPIFYLFHNFHEYLVLKWQLSDSKFLVPESYSGFPKLNSNTKKITKSNIETDFLTYFNETSVKEAFQLGFGDLCWIPDLLIKPINRMIKNEMTEVPIAVNRLPQSLLEKYFPKFFSGQFNFFNYELPNIGNCNKNSLRKLCKSMPLTQPFNSTANGRRQLSKFRFAGGLNIVPFVSLGENVYYSFMNDMLNAHYCSPYV